MEEGGQHHAPAASPPPSPERPGTHCTEGWVGPRAGLDGCGKPDPMVGSFERCNVPVNPTVPVPVAVRSKG
jgi:hypothetical protein